MKMNFGIFQIQKLISQTGGTAVSFLFSFLIYSPQIAKNSVFLQIYVDLSKKSKSKQFTYIHLKVVENGIFYRCLSNSFRDIED